MTSPYGFQEPNLSLAREALDIVAGSRDAGALHRAEASQGLQPLLGFLDYHGLAPLLFTAIGGDTAGTRLGAGLKGLAIRSLVHTQQQLQAMRRIREALEGAGIPYAFFKGAAHRLSLYRHPADRPAADIDLLVPAAHRETLVERLVAAGLRPRPDPATLSHELILMDGELEVDVHWHLMRPERLRSDPVPAMLERRVQAQGHWILAGEDALFVALVHPAFAKYVNAPWAKLIRTLDLQRLLARHPLPLRLLGDTGTRTAAWATLSWQRILTGDTRADRAMAALAPGTARRTWLSLWIARGLTQRLHGHRQLMRLGLTLALHDRPGDALRVLRRALAPARPRQTGREIQDPGPSRRPPS